MAKKNNKQQNPFVLAEYVGPEYFCDRIEETEELIANLQNGRNTTLISPRRIGKTGLIRNAFYQIRKSEKDAICIYIDIYSTKNQHDFVQVLGTAIAQYMLSFEQQALKRLLQFFGSWRPVFSADPVKGMPTVSVSIEAVQTEMTLKMIFDYLKQSRHNIFIAIDEFQQITYYPETGTEALLRSYMQFAPNVHFVFSGSKQHLMAQIFNSPDRPFYQSTTGMGLYPLHEEIYYDFARRFFEARRGSLSKEIFHVIYMRFGGITANIQQILNRLYEQGKTVSEERQVTEAIQHIINRSSMQYEGLVLFLTENQLSLLKAIAKAGCVKSPQSNEFIRNYELPSASSVKTALTVLIDKDLVYHDAQGYTVYDKFFDIWLKQLI
ncbi:MAG: ATP-binding protein [Prevotella sp.]|nr:ATP-binding protein [Prevotella sp.]